VVPCWQSLVPLFCLPSSYTAFFISKGFENMATNLYMTYLRKVIKKSNVTKLIEIKKNISKEIDQEICLRERTGIAIKQITKNVPSKQLIPIPAQKVRFAQRIKYIRHILNQKWGFLFDDIKTSEERIFYVYAHVDPSIKLFDLSTDLNIVGFPFYIGKGTGERAWDLSRNQGHGAKIREVVLKGFSSQRIVNIVRPNLTEAEAYELEAKLIYIFQTVYEDQVNGVLFNIDKERRPKFIESTEAERVVLKRRSSFGSIIEGRVCLGQEPPERGVKKSQAPGAV